MSRLNK
jgi:hypothetical protein